jgi:hypothetical protein
VKRLSRFFVRLYPARWRERYGNEFEIVIEDTRADWHSAIDVLKGAAKMQMNSWAFWKITLVCVAIGVLMMGAIAFAIPSRWTSQATLAVTADPKGMDTLSRTERLVLSANALVRLIQNRDLYPGERTRMPVDEVLDNMRRHIQLVPAEHLSPATYGLEIKFEYPDRMLAQRVVADLAYDFTHVVAGPDVAEHSIELLQTAILPTDPIYPRRGAMLGGGLGGGLLGGMMLATFVRARRRPALCPTCGQPVAAGSGITAKPEKTA